MTGATIDDTAYAFGFSKWPREGFLYPSWAFASLPFTLAVLEEMRRENGTDLEAAARFVAGQALISETDARRLLSLHMSPEHIIALALIAHTEDGAERDERMEARKELGMAQRDEDEDDDTLELIVREVFLLTALSATRDMLTAFTLDKREAWPVTVPLNPPKLPHVSVKMMLPQQRRGSSPLARLKKQSQIAERKAEASALGAALQAFPTDMSN